VNIFVSSAPTEKEIVDIEQVTSFNYNFTQNISQPLFMVIQPQSGASNGDFEVEFTVAYYEYDPNCPEFTKWNGTDCEVNYTQYCASLTDQYAE
jgi:hypothetical protein